MTSQPSIFRGADSKYFLRTAFRILVVPTITTVLMFYSLWMYLEMIFFYFSSKGTAISDDVKDAFIDHLLSEQTGSLPWIFTFFIIVFFIGLFLAHLILRQFRWVAQVTRESRMHAEADLHIDTLTSQQLVVKATKLLLNFLVIRNHHIPPELAQIKGPKLDFVFYLQYSLCMLILSMITTGAVYVGLNVLHAEIVSSAVDFLKMDSQASHFLMDQHELMTKMGNLCALFSISLYAFIAHGMVKDVEGVSYAYLRDIRKVIEGDYGRRLRPRFIDPGTDAALAINELLDHYFPNTSADEGEEVAPPPPIPGMTHTEEVKDQKEIEKLFSLKKL